MSDTLAPLFTWRSAVASEHGPDKPTHRLVLLTLSLYMNEKGGSCFPSYDLLQEATGLARATVADAIKTAKEDGWLVVSKHGYAGQKWARNEYRAALPEALKKAVQKAVQPVNHLPEGSSNDDGRQFNTQRKAVQPVNSNSSKNSPENSTGGAHAFFSAELGYVPEYIDRVTPTQPLPVAIYTAIVGRPPNAGWWPNITRAVPEHRAALRAWAETLMVWQATTEPGHVGKPYNLGNVRGLVDAFNEANKTARTGTAGTGTTRNLAELI